MNRRMPAAAIALALALGTGLLAPLPAAAQDKYPSKPVRILVPYAPGGATDIVARLLADQLKQIFGQTFVVENKPGAFGILAIEEMARSRPDGYTLMIGNVSTNAITPVLFPRRLSISYDKDVTAVARLADLPSFLLVTTRNFAPTTFREFVDYAKGNPGKVRYGSAGVGSIPHYETEVLARQAGIELVHIPNKAGASGFLNDILTGDVHAGFVNVATAAPQLKAGRVRALATNRPDGLPDYPDIPGMKAIGHRGTGSSNWQIMTAPAATPRSTIEALHKATGDALNAPAMQEAFKKSLIRALPTASVEESQAWLRGEMDNWRRITSEVKIDLAE